MVTFPMTLTDPNPIFKVMAILSQLSQKLRLKDKISIEHQYDRNRTQSIEWCHFQWPWETYDPNFKVTTFLKSNIVKTARFKDKVTVAQ